MADYLPQNSGLWSTTTWITAVSNLTAFAGVPPTIIDDVYADGKTITIDVNTAVNSIRTTTSPRTGGLAGGNFRINNAISLSANILAGTSTCLSFLSASPNSCTIVGNISGSTTASTSVAGLLNNTTGTVTVYGDIYGGQVAGNIADINGITSNGNLNIFGNCYGGSSTSGTGCRGISMGGSSRIINIVGNCYGVTSSVGGGGHHGLFSNTTTGVVNITGNCYGGFATGNFTGGVRVDGSNTTLNLSGNTYGGGGNVTNAGIIVLGTNIVLNIVGNAIGSDFSGGGSGYLLSGVYGGIVNLSGSTIGGLVGVGIHSNRVTIVGNAIGGPGAGAHGIRPIDSGGNIVIIGNAIGGTGAGAHGVFNSSAFNNAAGIVTLSGSAIGGRGSASYGAANNLTGILRVKRAVGNDWGLGYTTALGASPGVLGALSAVTIVEELQCGARGQWPTAGNIYFTPNTKATAVFETDTFQNYTLIQSNSADNLLPAVSSVRQGEVYDLGDMTGTCIIPPTSSVAFNTLVDNLTGTAFLTPQITWSYPTTASDIDSMGGRLRNALNTQTANTLINSFNP